MSGATRGVVVKTVPVDSDIMRMSGVMVTISFCGVIASEPVPEIIPEGIILQESVMDSVSD